MQTLTHNGKDIRYAAVGSVKVDGEWAGYIRERGVGRFNAFLNDGENIGEFRTRSLALKAIADTV